MSADEQCLGICDFDWEQGICLGCGRSEEAVFGSADSADSAPAAAAGPAPGLDDGQPADGGRKAAGVA